MLLVKKPKQTYHNDYTATTEDNSDLSSFESLNKKDSDNDYKY